MTHVSVGERADDGSSVSGEEEEPLPIFFFKDELVKAITDNKVGRQAPLVPQTTGRR